MGDPVLTSTQKKILELCAQHQDGLTFKGFIKENYRKNLGISLNELDRLLSELVFLRLLRVEETIIYKLFPRAQEKYYFQIRQLSGSSYIMIIN